MDRIIEIKVSGNYLSKDNRNAGVKGEGNITKLRITFAEDWDSYAKTITFIDAHGENPVQRVLTTDMLEDILTDTRVYLVPIPAEAMAQAGKMTFVIDGYTNGVRQRSITNNLWVYDAPVIAGEPVDPTPTQAEQLQVQIDGIIRDIHDAIDAKIAAIAAKEAIENMTVSTETVSSAGKVFVEKTKQDDVINLHFGIPKGEKGDTGEKGDKGDRGETGGMHYGTDEPTDPDVNVWINPNGDPDVLGYMLIRITNLETRVAELDARVAELTQ